MKWVFWISVALIAYSYVGYAVWLWIRSRWRVRPVQRRPFTPFVSIVLVVRNEEKLLEEKLHNLRALNYPAERREIIVVSDGSTDGTVAVLAKWANPAGVAGLNNVECRGKAAGLNDALATARGEIVFFTDVRQKLEPDSLQLLLENFADSEVGCVSGELMLGDPGSGEANKGIGLYWKIEKQVREMESASGSVIGATGAIYAARRELISAIPQGTILDDVYIPMQIVRQDKRVIFDSRARAWDAPNLGTGREFARKVRTLGGNYQLLQLLPWLLGRSNPVRFEFISHKLLRLLVPFALVAALVTSALLPGTLYRTATALQLAFYGLSLLSLAQLKVGVLARPADVAFTIVVLNSAAAVAFFNFIFGRTASWGQVNNPAKIQPQMARGERF